MTDLTTIELRNPAGVEMVRDLLEAGLNSNPSVKEREGAIEWIENTILNPLDAIFVVRDVQSFHGYVVLNMNETQGAFAERAWVSYVYSDGSPGVRKALLKATMEWMALRGLSSIFSLNQSGRSDEEMIASAPEYDHRVVGSVIESTPKE